jgi:hypothetical protein
MNLGTKHASEYPHTAARLGGSGMSGKCTYFPPQRAGCSHYKQGGGLLPSLSLSTNCFFTQILVGVKNENHAYLDGDLYGVGVTGQGSVKSCVVSGHYYIV